MKLYLSSFGLGDHPEELVALTGEGKRIGLILNALDHRQVARDRFLGSQTEGLEKLGFTVEEIDLRMFFGKQEELKSVLDEKDAVWINGGNTFLLRRAMRQSGFDKLITERMKNDTIVYAGFSAAAVILVSDLHGLDITDNPTEVSEGYNPETIWEGLGLIDFSIAVHYQSDHEESHLTDKEIEYYKTNNIPYKTLRDGQVLIKKDEEIRIVG